MVKENNNWHKLSLGRLIYPLFIKQEEGRADQVKSMPGVFRYSLESLKDQLAYLDYLGIRNILLFGVADKKSWYAEAAWENNSFLTQAISFIKSYYPGFRIFTDICLCAYASHGHCGIVKEGENNIDQQATLKALAAMAFLHAKAGADFVCPSAMTQGQVKAIRQRLDQDGFSEVKIMSYSAKFASGFYGPFRQVANSAPRFGNRRAYQLNFEQSQTAFERIEQDIKGGADIVMVKPALAYLDIIAKAKQRFKYPLAAYNVSGEYAMAKFGSQLGLWSEKDFVFELMSAIRRSGADYIISYHVVDIARWQKNYEKERILHSQQSAA